MFCPTVCSSCQTLRCLLGIGRGSIQIFEEVSCPRMPCSVPGNLQGLAGGCQGQEVRGGGQDAAEGADSMMACCLEWDVIPGRQYQKCKRSIMLNSGETNEIRRRVFTCVLVTVAGRRVPGWHLCWICLTWYETKQAEQPNTESQCIYLWGMKSRKGRENKLTIFPFWQSHQTAVNSSAQQSHSRRLCSPSISRIL